MPLSTQQAAKMNAASNRLAAFMRIGGNVVEAAQQRVMFDRSDMTSPPAPALMVLALAMQVQKAAGTIHPDKHERYMQLWQECLAVVAETCNMIDMEMETGGAQGRIGTFEAARNIIYDSAAFFARDQPMLDAITRLGHDFQAI